MTEIPSAEIAASARSRGGCARTHRGGVQPLALVDNSAASRTRGQRASARLAGGDGLCIHGDVEFAAASSWSTHARAGARRAAVLGNVGALNHAKKGEATQIICVCADGAAGHMAQKLSRVPDRGPRLRSSGSGASPRCSSRSCRGATRLRAEPSTASSPRASPACRWMAKAGSPSCTAAQFLLIMLVPTSAGGSIRAARGGRRGGAAARGGGLQGHHDAGPDVISYGKDLGAGDDFSDQMRRVNESPACSSSAS
jgi:hypothetical protein